MFLILDLMAFAMAVADMSRFGSPTVRHRILLSLSLLVVLLVGSVIVCVLFLGDRPDSGSGEMVEDLMADAALEVFVGEVPVGEVHVNEVHVGSEVEFCEAVKTVRSGTPLVIILDGDIELTESLRISTEIVLMSNSDVEFFKLSGRFEGSTITVGAGGVLDLSGIIVTHTGDTFGSGVTVRSGGTLLMSAGEISGNTADHGGGVYLYGSFTMSGGKISNNTAQLNGGGVFIGASGSFSLSGGSISVNTVRWGGGGGVLNYGSFSLSGGTISGNIVNFGGGGVNNWGGTFSFSGGKITGNTAVEGGGIYNYISTVRLSGGEISENTATQGGGGVYCVCSYDRKYNNISLSGVVISSNRATDGGGMYIEAGIVELLSGKISSNTASNDGGGIWLNVLDYYGRFYVADGFIFSYNHASTAYNRVSDHDGQYNTQIAKNVTWTIPFTQGYNNYDLSYTNGTLFYGSSWTSP